MISCQTFRANLQPGMQDAAMLEHLRHCDACLNAAVNVDPDLFFRSIGGEEMIPPGGVDAFVGDVMAQVRSRETESAAEPDRTFSNVRRLAIAATIAAAGITGLMISNHRPVEKPPHVLAVGGLKPAATPVTKPIVETYESKNATIVEVPSEAKDDVQVVMIFDETLPADL